MTFKNWPDVKYHEWSGREEYRLPGIFDVYCLTPYGDKSWHIALVGESRGQVFDFDSLDDAKQFTIKETKAYLESKYERSRDFVKTVEQFL